MNRNFSAQMALLDYEFANVIAQGWGGDAPVRFLETMVTKRPSALLAVDRKFSQILSIRLCWLTSSGTDFSDASAYVADNQCSLSSGDFWNFLAETAGSAKFAP